MRTFCSPFQLIEHQQGCWRWRRRRKEGGEVETELARQRRRRDRAGLDGDLERQQEEQTGWQAAEGHSFVWRGMWCEVVVEGNNDEASL